MTSFYSQIYPLLEETDEYLEEYFEFNKMFTDVYNSYFSFAKTKGIYIKLREDYE